MHLSCSVVQCVCELQQQGNMVLRLTRFTFTCTVWQVGFPQNEECVVSSELVRLFEFLVLDPFLLGVWRVGSHVCS